jgi:hypothetical protein
MAPALRMTRSIKEKSPFFFLRKLGDSKLGGSVGEVPFGIVWFSYWPSDQPLTQPQQLSRHLGCLLECTLVIFFFFPLSYRFP